MAETCILSNEWKEQKPKGSKRHVWGGGNSKGQGFLTEKHKARINEEQGWRQSSRETLIFQAIDPEICPV